MTGFAPRLMFPKAAEKDAAPTRCTQLVEIAMPPPITEPVIATQLIILDSRMRAQGVTPELTDIVRGVWPGPKMGWWFPPGQR
jgi:hypothetical protein